MFCAGADLKSMNSSHPGDSARSMDLSVIESLLKGRRLTKPLRGSCSRRGPAIAGGTEIPAGDRASGWPARAPVRGKREPRWGPFLAGRVGGSPGTPDPVHRCGGPVAERVATILAPEAKELDLLYRSRGARDGQALERRSELRRADSAANGPLAVQAILAGTIRETEGSARERRRSQDRRAKLGMAVFQSEERWRRLRALFAEKRTPNFRASLNSPLSWRAVLRRGRGRIR